MQANIIKDVIDKIISINKDLTEESLVNLLIASGWDKDDIEIAKSLFYKTQFIPIIKEIKNIEIKEISVSKVDLNVKSISVCQDTVPTVTEKISQNAIVIKNNSMPAIHNIYDHTIKNFNTKSLNIKNTLKGDENKTLYIWVNISILIILLIILAAYTMSFSW